MIVNESKLENTLQDTIQENFSNLASQATIQVQEIQRTPKRYFKKSNPKAYNHQIHQGSNEGKNARAAREKGQVTHNRKPISLTADLSAKNLQASRVGGQYSTSLKRRTFNLEFHIQPN